MIRPAQNQDFKEILMIYAYARKFMAEHGNPTQWGSTSPREEVLRNDIRQQQLYVIENDAKDKILGVFALIIGEDPTYQRIEQGSWKDESLYGTLHRVASAPGAHGILEQALDFSSGKITHLRIDTHEDNEVMQHLILKNGFEKRGIIYTDDGSPRFAYEKTDETKAWSVPWQNIRIWRQSRMEELSDMLMQARCMIDLLMTGRWKLQFMSGWM